MNNHDSYDQYADQLLNSVFANVKQSSTAAHTSHEDHLLNQLFQNARISSPIPPSPLLNNTNTEWLLLQQLQQQQQLIEKQLSALTASKTVPSSPAFQVPVVEPSAISPSQNTELEQDVKSKKIARVPVQQQQAEPSPPESNAALVKATAAAVALHNSGNRPALPKKKSFIRRTLSRRNFKDRENQAPAYTEATTAVQSVQPKAANQQKPVKVEKSPTFWRPREEKPKGWWKGNRSNPTTKQQQQYYQYEEEEEDEKEEEEEESSEEEIPLPVPAKKSKKKVVKKVAVPHLQKVPQQKVSSIKKKSTRPMAFKAPTVKGKKKKNKVKQESAAKSVPKYAIPQQPMYYQQPMMVAPQQPYIMPGQARGGYYCMPGQGMMMPPLTQQNEEPASKTAVTRRKTVLNPRESSNDKCSIM
jgi:hypothetical protein